MGLGQNWFISHTGIGDDNTHFFLIKQPQVCLKKIKMRSLCIIHLKYTTRMKIEKKTQRLSQIPTGIQMRIKRLRQADSGQSIKGEQVWTETNDV